MITGGDLAGKNIVYIDGKIKIIKSKLIESENTHGLAVLFLLQLLHTWIEAIAKLNLLKMHVNLQKTLYYMENGKH